MEPIIIWAERNLRDLRAVYLPGHLNRKTNLLSRSFLDSNKWSLLLRIFSWIVHRWDLYKLALFAAVVNAKLPRFISRLPHPVGRSDGCPVKFLAIQPSLCLSSVTSCLEILLQISDREDNGHSNPTILTETSMVLNSNVPERQSSSEDTFNIISPVTRASHPFEPPKTEPPCLDNERQKSSL